MKRLHFSTGLLSIKLGLLACCAVWSCAPALADHGKDFLLLETDDMPQKGRFYAIAAVDVLRDAEGTRTTEITPGLLFGTGPWAFEPHFHVARTRGGEEDEGFRYEAAAFGVRYRVGNIGNSEWRLALSAEVEKPRGTSGDSRHHELHARPRHVPRHVVEEHSSLSPRLILVRTLPSAMVAINLIGEREMTSGAEWEKAIGVGILKPLSNGHRIGLEVVARLPVREGVEIVPGYHMQFGKRGQTGLKIGLGYFHARDVSSGTLHVRLIREF